MRSDRVRQCPYLTRRLRCVAVGVNANVAEVISESGLKHCSCGRIERPPRRTQDVMHRGRRNAGEYRSTRRLLSHYLLLLVVLLTRTAFALQPVVAGLEN